MNIFCVFEAEIDNLMGFVLKFVSFEFCFDHIQISFLLLCS
jgi:hypothetical protein